MEGFVDPRFAASFEQPVEGGAVGSGGSNQQQQVTVQALGSNEKRRSASPSQDDFLNAPRSFSRDSNGSGGDMFGFSSSASAPSSNSNYNSNSSANANAKFTKVRH